MNQPRVFVDREFGWLGRIENEALFDADEADLNVIN